MDPAAIAALVNIGVAGIGLYLFAQDKLRTKAATDEQQARSDDRLVEVRALYEVRITEGDERYDEMRTDRDEWKKLALGTERRLDAAVPAIAVAVGASVPSLPPAPPEAG